MLAHSPFHRQTRLTSSQEDLKASRDRYDQATGSAVSSAAGHRQTVEPEITAPTPLPSMSSPAGSMFSNERVIFPTPVERPAAEIITPGMRRLTPTQLRLVDTSKLEASGPEELHQPHAIFRDPEHAKFASLTNWTPSDASSKDADCFDLRYFPELNRNGNSDQFNEIITSYSDSLKNYPPMGRSQRCLDIVDSMMQGDGGDMVLFGRWRHRKDAPLSQVEAMIDQELRGPGACSLYGPRGLDTKDHPLVRHYIDRVGKLQDEMTGNSETPETPLLSPILLQGSSVSQRYSMRSSTPVTFGITTDGTFKTTGFQTRTASAGSTVESVSSTESSELAAHNARKDTRRDSGVQGVQPDASPEQVLDRTGHSSLSNYEVLRYYSPDPALNYKSLNDQTAPKYHRQRLAMVTAPYIQQWCGGYNRNTRPAAPARLPQQQRQHAQTTQDSAQHSPLQFQKLQPPYNRNVRSAAPARLPEQQMPHAQTTQNSAHQSALESQKLQPPYNRNTGQTKRGHELQRFHSRRPGQQDQHDYTARHQHEAPPTRHMQHQRSPISALPHQALGAKRTRHVHVDESKNVSYALPAAHDRKVTHVKLEDAENAIISDDEDAVIDIQEASNKDNNVTNASQPRSLSSKGLRKNRSLSNASPGTHRTTPMPHSILKTSSSNAARSISSSDASATAKETAGLNTSTELTPLHATPGTTASSGREYQITSPTLVRSITRKLDERLKRLKQTETRTSYKNGFSL